QAIYQQGIDTGDATFETRIKNWDEWNAVTARAARLVAVEGEKVIGWASLSDVASRCVYRGVAETSVYVNPDYQGRGVGRHLLQALIDASEAAGYWTLLARIFPENVASIVLHEKLGFESMGTHIKLGKLNGFWRDVQLLERRSDVIGQD
ncbi:MAG: N-acetyltransferase, partial [Proteobacteria bacterium]|nr:N-acetyltransferase [Pseudomonadota bacterium]